MKNNKSLEGTLAKGLGKSGIAFALAALSQTTLAATALESGTPVTGINGTAGSSSFYTLDVESGATDLNFNTTGGSGDADLYVGFGSDPTTRSEERGVRKGVVERE